MCKQGIENSAAPSTTLEALNSLLDWEAQQPRVGTEQQQYQHRHAAEEQQEQQQWIAESQLCCFFLLLSSFNCAAKQPAGSTLQCFQICLGN